MKYIDDYNKRLIEKLSTTEREEMLKFKEYCVSQNMTKEDMVKLYKQKNIFDTVNKIKNKKNINTDEAIEFIVNHNGTTDLKNATGIDTAQFKYNKIIKDIYNQYIRIEKFKKIID